MERKSTLEINLKKYVGLAGGVTAVAGLNAQVMHTDVNPDYVVSPGGNTQYAVDFNNDAAYDVAFVAGGWSGSTGTWQGYNYVSSGAVVQIAFGSTMNASNAWMGASSGPSPLSAGTRIGSSGAFFADQKNVVGTQYVSWPNSTQYNTSYDLGNFSAGATDQYIGVRFVISGDVHYGWIRVDVGSDGKSLTFKDYAYEQTPDTPIEAGSTASMASVDELASQVAVRNINNNLNINLDGINNANLAVFGLDGKQYINKTIGSVDVVSLADLSTGIYMVNVSTEEGTTTKKIYVK